MSLLLLLKAFQLCLRAPQVSEKMHKSTVGCVDLSEIHLVIEYCDAIFGTLFFVIIQTCSSGIRFIELREDYKSAKLASRLSSLWQSSS